MDVEPFDDFVDYLEVDLVEGKGIYFVQQF